MLNFKAIIAFLGGDPEFFRIAQAARAAGDYLLATLLPEVTRSTYRVESGSFTVRATMAGLVGMDSHYPPGGLVEASKFMEETAKIANQVRLNEKAIRELQEMQMRLNAGGGNSKEALAEEVLNFFDKVIMQPHLDTFEWLRAQALQGTISWTFGKIPLEVDYGVPAANILPTRTVAGGTNYAGASSAFWSDIRELKRILKGNLRMILCHPDTLDEIIFNEANGMRVVTDTGIGPIRTVSLQRFATDPNTSNPIPGQDSSDARDRTVIVSYAREAEIINPADPTTTIQIPFIPRGKLIAVGNNTDSGFIVGRGSTEEDPLDSNRLGYTHIGPTVEGDGQPGRWGRVYTPENEPYHLIGQAVTNGLPVIEAPEKIAVATTEMAA